MENQSLDILLSRSSASAVLPPAPSEDDLQLILQCGLRAPDHGRLKPWRFILIRDEAREGFADLLVRALKARVPEASDKRAAMLRNYYAKIPLIVALGAAIDPGHSVPAVEQMLSVAAAGMNMLNAAHALGYGALWVTGDSAYDANVAAGLGLAPPSQLIGFLCLGAPGPAKETPPRPDLADHVKIWAPQV